MDVVYCTLPIDNMNDNSEKMTFADAIAANTVPINIDTSQVQVQVQK